MSCTNTALRFVLGLDKSSQQVRREFSIVLSIYSCTCRRSGFQFGHTRRTLLDEILGRRQEGERKFESTALIWKNKIKWAWFQIGQNVILACCVCWYNTVVSCCIYSIIQMTKFVYYNTYCFFLNSFVLTCMYQFEDEGVKSKISDDRNSIEYIELTLNHF